MFKYSHVLYAIDLSDKNIDLSINRLLNATKDSNIKVTIAHYVPSISMYYNSYPLVIDKQIQEDIVNLI